MKLASSKPWSLEARSTGLLVLTALLVAGAATWTIGLAVQEPSPGESLPIEPLANPEVRSMDLKIFTVMIGDDASPTPLPIKELERRMTAFSALLEQASLGRIKTRVVYRTLYARDLGVSSLADLARGFFEWRKRVVALWSEVDFDVLVVAASDARPEGFCEDSATLGSPLESKITLCLDEYIDVRKKEDDQAAAALLVHKLMHGFGFNHQVPEHKPLLFLEWALGLPRTVGSGFEGFRDDPPRYFDPYVLRALGILPQRPFEKGCLIKQGLVCLPSRGSCSNLYDIACLDSDSDGLVDSLDPYPLSPPGSKSEADKDKDGIPDRLDLCTSPVLEVQAEGLVGPAKVVFGENSPSVTFRFVGARLLASQFSCADLSSGFTRFPQKRALPLEKGPFVLPDQCPIARVELRYRWDREYIRPFYLYQGQQRWETIWDKEWLYFSRFGCDVPVEVDFKDHSTYDADLDGLPDDKLFAFAQALRGEYDWDADGTPDREDTLPTVHGKCRNNRVRGVPDSDGDGLCDPSNLKIVPYQKGTWPEDLGAKLLKDPQADDCPYTAGSANSGCP
jgi:hypothetical protein